MLNEDISERNLNFESYKERITNFSQEFELGLFIFILKRSLIWITLCVLTALASAFLYLRYTAPTYEARTLLQLRESNTAKQVLSMTTFVEDNNMQADVELMRSKIFIDRALRKLPLEVSYFNRGQVLTEEYYTWSFFHVVDLDILDTTVKDIPIFLDIAVPNELRIAYSVDGKPFEGVFQRNELIRTPHFTCRIVIQDHPSLKDPDAKFNLYFKINSREYLVSRYSQQLTIKTMDGNAKTVDITCKDQNPALARDLAQSMAETFITSDVERQSESAESVISFIRSQKDTVFNQLRESEFRLQNFRLDNKVADLSQLTPMFLERTKQYEDEVIRLTLDIELLKAIAKATEKPFVEINSYDLLPLLTGTEYETMLNKTISVLLDLLQQREELYLEATPENLTVRSLEHQIEVQKRVVLESIQGLLSRAEERRREIDTIQKEFVDRYRTLPEKELEYARIERVFAINEKYYTLLLEKDIEYRISKAGFVPENRILETAG